MAVVNAGDMDGDGIDDFAISSYRGDPIDPISMGEVDAAGIVHVFTSTVSGFTALEDADLQLYGDVFFAYVGHDLFKAGDINGDGLSDLLVGARSRPTSGSVFGFWRYRPAGRDVACRMPRHVSMEIPIKLNSGKICTTYWVTSMVMDMEILSSEPKKRTFPKWIVAPCMSITVLSRECMKVEIITA